MARLRIGSRGSQLALWQADYVASRLRERGHLVEIEVIHTSGDKLTEIALTQAGSKGIFIKEIEEALAAGAIDLAVHSLKDLPTELAAGFELAAVPAREDARDALISRKAASLLQLGPRARVGTSSLRRQAQLKALRPDVVVVPVRGNVDTRLRKVETGEYDAIIVAVAGVKRLGRMDSVRQALPVEVMCPAPGQGALAVEIRQGDAAVGREVKFLEDGEARAATDCERALLRGLGGGCQVPIAAYARREGSGLHLLAKVARADGSGMLVEEASGADPHALGKSVAEKLLRRGAAEILRQVYGGSAAAPQQP